VKRTLAVAAAVAALLSAAPGAAQAAPVDDKNLCKDGGFANYVDPTTDLPFKNQGRCVSFVNAGGTLVPVEDEPPVAIFPTAKLTVGEFTDGAFPVTVEAQGSPSTAYTLTVGGEARTVTTNADGLATFTVNAQPETTLTVAYQGQTIGSVTTPAAPSPQQITVQTRTTDTNIYPDGRMSVDWVLGAYGLTPNGPATIIRSGGYEYHTTARADGSIVYDGTLSCGSPEVPLTIQDDTTGVTLENFNLAVVCDSLPQGTIHYVS
jgi:hypothetical protein